MSTFDLRIVVVLTSDRKAVWGQGEKGEKKVCALEEGSTNGDCKTAQSKRRSNSCAVADYLLAPVDRQTLDDEGPPSRIEKRRRKKGNV